MFHGADVSQLDRMAQKAQSGADFARKVALTLKAVVRALQAMSWTGWAAAYARYLEVTVIPWVEATGKALERFAQVLQLASRLQKGASEDSPQISIPATAYQPPALPATTAVNAPQLTAPTPAISQSQMSTMAVGAGAIVFVPAALGNLSPVITGSSGGGANASSPGAVPVAQWRGGNGASGTTGAYSGAAQLPGELASAPSHGSQATGGGAHVIGGAITSPVTSGGPTGGSFGGGGSSPGSALGGLPVGGSIGASSSGASSAGPVTTEGVLGGGSASSPSIAGNPAVNATPVSATGELPGLTGLAGTLSETGGGPGAAALAAPLGAAGLGAAGLGALRGRQEPAEHETEEPLAKLDD